MAVTPAPNLGELKAPGGNARRRWFQRPAFASAVAVVIVGSGVGTSLAANSPAPGASTPSSAVSQLLDAVEHSDVLGVLAALAPGERAAIEPGLLGLVSQLQRLDVLSSSASLAHVDGVSIGFSGVKTTTSYLSPSLAAVTLTSGRVVASADLSQLPLGTFVRGLVAGAGSGTRRSSSSAATGRSAIVTVEQNGRWYVSLGYTAAVDALRAKGQSGAPPAGGGIVPTGATSPTALVENLLRSAGALDLRGVIADLAPGEMGALQAYGSRLLSAADPALARARSKLHVSLGDVKLQTTALSDGVLVKIDSMDLAISDGSAFSLSYANGCLTETVNASTIRRCPTASPPSASSVPAALQPIYTELLPLFERLSSTRPAIGLVAVQENGHYYWSPARTVLTDLDAFLARLAPGDLVAIVHAYTQFEQLLRSGLLPGAPLSGASFPRARSLGGAAPAG